MEIRINPLFRDLLPALTSEEKEGLEKDILKEGCREPLIIWDGTIIDGHNRYSICKKHNIEFKILEKDFKSEDHAIVWMSNNQSHRRNLNNAWKIEIGLIEKDALLRIGEKKKATTIHNQERDILGRVKPLVSENDSSGKHSTRKEIAKKAKVSTGLVGMAEQVKKKAPEAWEKAKKDEIAISTAYKEMTKKEGKKKAEKKKEDTQKKLAKSVEKNRPQIKHTTAVDFLNAIEGKTQDLLITDPPYSTDIEDIDSFIMTWLPMALSKVKDTGRAFIFIGAYPKEIYAYLNLLLQQDRFIVDNPLIWTYRNTLGQTPKDKYNLNYQMIIHLYTKDSPKLDTTITGEMFSVQNINAPDGRQGNRFYKWQKPIELASRLINHATKSQDTIFDPFAGSGTFLIAGKKLNRNVSGCEIDDDVIKIAEGLGCERI